MALSLNQVEEKKTATKAKTKKAPKRARPWQAAEQTWANEKYRGQTAVNQAPEDFDFSFVDEMKLETMRLPMDLDHSSSPHLVALIVKKVFSQQWRAVRKKSYLLSRLTHQQSWLLRIQVSPSLRVPLPSFFTRKLHREVQR